MSKLRRNKTDPSEHADTSYSEHQTSPQEIQFQFVFSVSELRLCHPEKPLNRHFSDVPRRQLAPYPLRRLSALSADSVRGHSPASPAIRWPSKCSFCWFLQLARRLLCSTRK